MSINEIKKGKFLIEGESLSENSFERKEQEEILKRREIIRRIISGEETKEKRENKSNGIEQKKVKENRLAFQQFLKKEGFYLNSNSKKIKKQFKNKNINNNGIKSEMLEISGNLITYFKELFLNIDSGIIKNNNIESTIEELKNKSNNIKLLGREGDNKDEIFIRLLTLDGYISEFLVLLDNSKDDTIEFYTNKLKILEDIKIILRYLSGIQKVCYRK